MNDTTTALAIVGAALVYAGLCVATWVARGERAPIVARWPFELLQLTTRAVRATAPRRYRNSD